MGQGPGASGMYVEANGASTYVERRGRGWPVVLVHALGMSLRRLREVRCSTLLLAGELDRLCPPEGALDVQARDSRLALRDTARHRTFQRHRSAAAIPGSNSGIPAASAARSAKVRLRCLAFIRRCTKAKRDHRVSGTRLLAQRRQYAGAQ
jgi:hypothetical protein